MKTDIASFNIVVVDIECVRSIIMNHAIQIRSTGMHYIQIRTSVVLHLYNLVNSSHTLSNVHSEFNIMMLRSIGIVPWLFNTMLDDAKHIGQVNSVITDQRLVTNQEQNHSLCTIIRDTGRIILWTMTQLVDDNECYILMNFLLSTIHSIDSIDSRHTHGDDSANGYLAMQITLFHVLTTLPTVMNNNGVVNILDVYGRVFIQSDGFFGSFIEAGRPWKVTVEALRFLITLIQSNVLGAAKIFIEIYHGLDEFADVGAIHLLLLSLWLGIDICTLNKEVFFKDGRSNSYGGGNGNGDGGNGDTNSLTLELLIYYLCPEDDKKEEKEKQQQKEKQETKETKRKEQKKHNVDDVICEMALEKIVDLLENNMRRQYGDINNDTKTRRDNINRTVVSFLAHLSTKIKFDTYVCHQLSRIAFASASHSNATETNTTCNMIGSTTFELNIMDDYMTIAQTNTSNTTTETIQASEVPEVKTKTKAKTNQNKNDEKSKSRSSTLSSGYETMNVWDELHYVDTAMFEEPIVAKAVLSILCSIVCRDLSQLTFSENQIHSRKKNLILTSPKKKKKKKKKNSSTSNPVESNVTVSLLMVFDSFPSHTSTEEILSFSAALLRQIKVTIRSENKNDQLMKHASSEIELCHLCEFLSDRCYDGW